MTRLAIALTVFVSMVAQPVRATDFSNVTSGLLLGVYASPTVSGMQVSGTIPGYSAEGRLFPGDVLLRTTIDGWQMYRLRTHYEMEKAKSAIGPGREAAVEIYRPGQGLIYAWVEFTPIGGVATYAVQGTNSPPQPRAQAQFRMESEKPGAKALFHRNGGPVSELHSQGNPHRPGRPGNHASGNAADLFNR